MVNDEAQPRTNPPSFFFGLDPKSASSARLGGLSPQRFACRPQRNQNFSEPAGCYYSIFKELPFGFVRKRKSGTSGLTQNFMVGQRPIRKDGRFTVLLTVGLLESHTCPTAFLKERLKMTTAEQLTNEGLRFLDDSVLIQLVERQIKENAGLDYQGKAAFDELRRRDISYVETLVKVPGENGSKTA